MRRELAKVKKSVQNKEASLKQKQVAWAAEKEEMGIERQLLL